jgi:Stage III sporulation protein AE (spore_III_AE).
MVVLAFPMRVRAADKNGYYDQQLKQSGAEELPDSLPNDTRKALDNLGINGIDWKNITSVTPGNLFLQILSIAGGKSSEPLKAAVSVTAIMLLCALLNGMKLSFGEKPMGGVIGMVGTLCICSVVVQPIVSCIANSAGVMKAAAGFLLACIPVLAGIMIAAGQPVSAGSYQLLMMAAGNVISVLSAGILVPMMNIFLALSVVSAVSPNINLKGLCDVFSKTVKWVIGFCMTVFTGLLTVHGIVAGSVDGAGSKTAKFVVSSFVPVVGNALGEALHTITGCVKMLKSGVSAFGLLAGVFIFLPVIVQCLMWLLTSNICAAIGDIFEQKEITSLLRACSTVLSTMLAILLSCMTVLTVSTVIMLIIGGAS